MNKITELQVLLAAGRITRRQFMEGVIAMGVVATAGVHMMDQAFAATPKKGGHFKLGLAGANTSDSLDGSTHSDTYMQMLGMGCIFDCLTEVAADGSLKGELAESWEATPDAKVWTFKLRKGVTFHNGKDFGADDMIESINDHIREESKSAAKSILQPIQGMKKLDSHTVEVSLAAGNADFPFLLSDYHILMFPAGMKEEAFSKGIGTGAYMLENFDPGVNTTVKRNPNDYRTDRGWFDSAEAIAMNDTTSRMNALATGAVHAINRADKKTLGLLQRNPQMEVHDITGNQHYTFPMLTKVAPFDNNDVRLALKYGVDRADMVKKILQGHGAVGNDHPIGPANQYLAAPDDIGGQREFDPDKAKHHLKKAGLDGLKVDLSASDGAFVGAVDAAILFQASAGKAGIEINVVRESADGYWSNVWLKKPWCACYWSGRATEDWMFNTAYEKGVPWNDSQWEHEKFNKLLLEARAELDTDKRRNLYREMQLITKDEGGVCIPMFANYVYATSKTVAHAGKLGNTWTMDGCRMIERWWMA